MSTRSMCLNVRRRSVRLILASLGILGVAPGAQAEVAYGLEARLGRSDNIGRVQDAEQSETIAVAGLNVSWLEDSQRLEADVAVDLSYFEYLDDTFDSELLGHANGSVIVGLIPERILWTFEDSFGQAQADPFAASTPETRENINYFTTGPDFILRLGSTGFVRLFGRYSATEFESSNFDSERMSAGLGVGRELSSRSRLSMNAITEDIDFENAVNADYERQSAFLRYELQGARTEVEAQLGYTWLDSDAAQEDGGMLARLSVSREVTTSSTVYISAGRQWADASDALRESLQSPTADRPVADAGQVRITAAASPAQTDDASIGWNFDRNRTAFGLSAGWRQESYETQPLLDRTSYAYDATASRQLGPSLQFGLLAAYVDEEFEGQDRTADEIRLGAFLSWRPGRNFEYALTFDRFDRDTSDGAQEYVENRAFLSVRYNPAGSQPERSR